MQEPINPIHLIISAFLMIAGWRVGVAIIRIAHALEAIAEDTHHIAASLSQIANVEMPVLVSAINELSDTVEQSTQPTYIEHNN